MIRTVKAHAFALALLVSVFLVQNVQAQGKYCYSGSTCYLTSLTVNGSGTFNTITVKNATNAITMNNGNILDISSGGYTGFVFNNTVNNKATGAGFISHAASGTNGYACDTNGCRIDFGAGANDYASSDGTTVTFAGAIGATALNSTSVSNGTIQPTCAGCAVRLVSNVADASNAVGVIADTAATYSTAGAKLYSIRNNTTEKASVDFNGAFASAALIGTAASGTGITANYSGNLRTWVHKVTVINTALAAAGTSDVTLAVTPVNSRIIRVTADVTQVFTGGTLSAMTVMCGNAAGGNQYLLAGSVFAAQTTLGDVAAEVGAGLLTATWADFGTPTAGVPGAITVQCRFTCTGANCSAATQGSVTFYVEGVTY